MRLTTKHFLGVIAGFLSAGFFFMSVLFFVVGIIYLNSYADSESLEFFGIARRFLIAGVVCMLSWAVLLGGMNG